MSDKMFQDLKTLEYFYNEGYITLSEYFKIKSNICDLVMKKFENEKDIEIITSEDEEFYSICIIINGWKYPYIIFKECDSVGKVIKYIVNDLKKVKGDENK